MELWSVQTPEVLECIEKDGLYICNPGLSEHITDFGFGPAYDWLVSQMESRIGPRPQGVTHPIWAWHTRDWKRHKPDLRESGYLARGQAGALLSLEVPDKDVLLSDFDAWHWPLNGWFLSAATNEVDCDREENVFKALSPEKKLYALHKSWEHIFDVSEFNSDWMSRGRYIQATFWALRKEYIQKVQRFQAR